METKRYYELIKDENAALNPEEVKAGWHFCADFDYDLIHNTWWQMDGCTCKDQTKVVKNT